MQCLTQLASPVHLPGSSRGSTLTFTRHDKPLLGQSHSSGALSPPSCTLIMTWCICAFHTFEGGHLSAVKYQSLTSHDEAPLGLANSFVMLSQLFFVTGHDGLLSNTSDTLNTYLLFGFWFCLVRDSQPLHLPVKKIHFWNIKQIVQSHYSYIHHRF